MIVLKDIWSFDVVLTEGRGIEKKSSFELFDHTADIGVHATGPNLSSVFEQAVLGMFAVIFHDKPPKVQPKGEYQIKLQATDLEQLLLDWLDELLYLFTTEHIIFSNYKIEIEAEKRNNKIQAVVAGAILTEKQLEGTREIKAVTYHMLSVKKVKTWEVQVIFDI